MRWLSWLAQQLVQRKQSVFYIERMQPAWLAGPWAQRRYPRVATGLIFAIIAALCLGPIGVFLLGQITHTTITIAGFFSLLLPSCLFYGSFFGLFNALAYVREKRPYARMGSLLRRSLYATLNAGLVVLLAALPYILSGFKQTSSFVLVGCSFLLLISWLIFMLIYTLLDLHVDEIQPAEAFAWSGSRVTRNLTKFLVHGLVGMALLILTIAVLQGLSDYLGQHIRDMMLILQHIGDAMRTIAPLLILLCALYLFLGVLPSGLSSAVIDERNISRPNQGIRLSLRHSLLVGCSFTLLTAVALGYPLLLMNPHLHLQGTLVYALLFGTLAGVVSALRAGGTACIEHFVLRWLLWETGALPWNYPRFLDYAVAHVLLRRVGGGYIFVHRLLLEYFASLPVER